MRHEWGMLNLDSSELVGSPAKPSKAQGIGHIAGRLHGRWTLDGKTLLRSVRRLYSPENLRLSVLGYPSEAKPELSKRILCQRPDLHARSLQVHSVRAEVPETGWPSG